MTREQQILIELREHKSAITRLNEELYLMKGLSSFVNKKDPYERLNAFLVQAGTFNNISNMKVLDKIPSEEEYPAINKWVYSSTGYDIVNFFRGGIFVFASHFMWLFDLAEEGDIDVEDERVVKLLELLQDDIFVNMFQEVFEHEISCFKVITS